MSSFRAARCLLNAVPRSRHSPRNFPASLILRPVARCPPLLQATFFRNYNSSAPRQKSVRRDDSSQESSKESAAVSPQFERKASTRSAANSKSTLRRVAATERKHAPSSDNDASRPPKQICTAYCTAEKYNLRQCNSLLKAGGYLPDPLSTGLGDEVIHLRLPLPPQACRGFPNSGADSYGDIFIFHSGNIVSWGIPEAIITSVAALIRPAAEISHSTTETETLEFVEDPSRPTSYLKGDLIIIGTGSRKLEFHIGLDSTGSPFADDVDDDKNNIQPDEDESSRRQATPTVLAKIAFSSGLARSTKLAVLEEMLESYIVSTSSIPVLLSQGSRLPFTRSFILRKTGELLSFRARLNLYSELTDSLPDIFWDSRKELGLEGYYESVGRELDVGVRIRQLNEKLDYASEMAAVLRERLSERHGLVLEWMIIILITIEVGFEILHLWKDNKSERRWEDEWENGKNSGPPPPSYSHYVPHDHHQHHQHHHQHPYPSYYYQQSTVPQQSHSQSTDSGKSMNDIDAVLALLDGIIARVSAEEEHKRQGRKGG